MERFKERCAPTTQPPTKKALFLFLLISLGLLMAQTTVWANGGTPRLNNLQAGPYAISAWTQPDPPRVGRMHISVAVMRPQDSSPILDARVRLAGEPVHGQEDSISANASRTSGLLYDADLQIPNEGRWRITVDVAGGEGTGNAGFELQVKPPVVLERPLLVTGVAFVFLVWIAWLMSRPTRKRRK